MYQSLLRCVMAMLLASVMTNAALAQCSSLGDLFGNFGRNDDSSEIQTLEPVRPTPGLAANAWLDEQGLVVNDTNGAHTISIMSSSDYQSIEVVVFDSSYTLLLWRTFDLLDVQSRGGLCRVYCHAGDDDVYQNVVLPLTVYGGQGNDTLVAGYECDHLYGEEGNDTLVAGSGRDYLSGGPGDDELYARDSDYERLSHFPPGDDVVYGGKGRDTFITDHGVASDRTPDFDPKEDVVR